MRPKRRKIQLDRGDTLGGTVPLLLSDSVQPKSGGKGFLHRERREEGRGGLYVVGFLTVLLLILLPWLLFPDLLSSLGLPATDEIWTRILGFLSLNE